MAHTRQKNTQVPPRGYMYTIDKKPTWLQSSKEQIDTKVTKQQCCLVPMLPILYLSNTEVDHRYPDVQLHSNNFGNVRLP